MNKTFYVTTAIPYVNASPHIGFAMEIIEADALARYHSLVGEDSYFLTGTDEHGSKLYKLAKEQGINPQEICDENAEKYEGLKKLLNLSNNDFIRTTDKKRHYPASQKLWQKLVDSGDIYKGSYDGLYCSGCEAFLNEKDLLDGKCPTHKKEPDKLSEENYFFKLSNYTEQILDMIESNLYEIVPAFRKNEILNVIKNGLHDVSFSRPKEVLPWGIPVPGDDSQVMYVWCDALSNYISALDYLNDGNLFIKFWQNCDQIVHVIGKDIVRFHVAIWPAMLLAAGIQIPHKVLVHGFITSEGQKMSKSLGNVVDPVEVVQTYGTDPLRYYLLSEIPVGKDGDFSLKRFEELYSSDLANNLGNLVNRVISMIGRYEVDLTKKDEELKLEIEETWKNYHSRWEKYELQLACHDIRELLVRGNQYIEQKKPWELAKIDRDSLEKVLFCLYELLRAASAMLAPIMPEASSRLRQKLGLKEIKTFSEEEEWGSINKAKLDLGEPLFPRLETK